MKTPVFMCCVNLEVFEALLLIRKLLIKKTGCIMAS